MTCLGHDSCIRIPREATTNEILHDMLTQFSEISSLFIQADKAKGVKRLLFRHNILSRKSQHLTNHPPGLKNKSVFYKDY